MFYSKLLHIIVFIYFVSSGQCERLRLPFEKKIHELPGRSLQTGRVPEEPSKTGKGGLI